MPYHFGLNCEEHRMAVEVIYETHSITTDNEAGIVTGWLPGELSAQGRLLARELGNRRRDDALATVFTSDLARAVETAELAFAGRGVPIIQDERLRECNDGEWNGLPTARLAGERAKRIATPFPGGESYRQVVERRRAFLHDLATVYDSRMVLLVARSANRWALEYLLNGLVDAPFDWQPGWNDTLPAGY
jgi:broad specificity phosphatase PhoE